MKEQAYGDEVLTEYLLGSLPEPETERLDELSVMDDDLAARLQVVENDLVDAYVRGDLSGKTLDKFNSHYLSSPLRREKVWFARGLQHLVDRASITAPAVEAVVMSSIAGKRPSRNLSRRWDFLSARPGLQWGLAAAMLVALVACAWLAFENGRLRNRFDDAQASREELQRREQELQTQLADRNASDSDRERELQSLREQIAQLSQRSPEQAASPGPSPNTGIPNIFAFALSPQMRGINQLPPIKIPQNSQFVTIQLELEPNDFNAYRVELKSGNSVVWRSGRLRASSKGDTKSVFVTLRAELLRPQIYVLETSGIASNGASEIIGTYPFRVIE